MTIINDVMRLMRVVLFNLGLVVAILILFYAFYLKDYMNDGNRNDKSASSDSTTTLASELESITTERNEEFKTENINLWCIFTKVDVNSILRDKFALFAKSLLNKASEPISLSVITDEVSKPVAEEILNNVQGDKKFLNITFMDVSILAGNLKRLVSIMSPHFSSRPGTYYSDALFFLSLGLHHIVGVNDQQKVIMTDVDIKFVGDIAELWKEFDKFSSDAIFGLGPELSPVYRHVFHSYRSSHPGTIVGEPLSENGYPGLNSGVILLNLSRMRKSEIYSKFIGDDNSSDVKEDDAHVTSVDGLVKKYFFKGHLGDQDFYTLLGAEYPELIHIIPCVWNRQLCTWWGERGGYGDVFDKYFKCDGKVKIYHGNCNSPFPENGD
ncbi:xyloside xylosyltransferase 1-like [Ischnura elegans]|uniref:xyloside xylosyltransferase 1-like n=1 Tax=Ischnura elegans TaxID=197161 RepID=UPI001ED8A451|nr:xyloside xylosyltransferase 1-like [Ischnura elegans]